MPLQPGDGVLKHANICPFLMVLACGANPIVFAADADRAPPQDLSQIRTLDEVVVSGKLTTLSGVHRAMVQAEERFYDRFNELIRKTNRELTITCRNEAPLGTNLKTRNCVTAKQDDLSHDQAMLLLSGHADSVGIMSAGQIQRVILPELRERTLTLLKTDDELLRALLEHARLQQIYEDMRKEKHKDHVAVWD
jgi:hypothetical protein